jgi:hypothetical protein
MLLAIGVILLILWLLGLFTMPSLGSLVYILLIVGIIMLVLHFVRGRNRA